MWKQMTTLILYQTCKTFDNINDKYIRKEKKNPIGFFI
jgi:hypothetical protein